MEPGIEILNGIGGLREMSLRRHRVSELVDEMDAGQVAVLVDRVMSGPVRQIDNAVYLDFIAALLFDPGLDYARRREVYEAMIGFGLTENAPIMLDIPDRYEQEGLPFYEFDDILLGVRKSKARTRHRDLLIRMCCDHDPDVIGILLENPVLTRAEALRIVSLRPQSTKVMQRVFCNPRWAYQGVLITALVLNPWAPTALAMALVPLLGRQDLEDASMDRTLHPLVRKMADRVYKRLLA